MKRLALVVVSALSLFVFSAFAEEFTGYITDSNCAAKQGAKAASDGHAGCAAGCIKKGAAAVLLTSEGKIYKIADQAKVTDHAGHKVTIEGKLDGDTIHVDSVKM
ncbi:MAG TPA: DUF5818 domain-containing protein [Bryobacteraceae bacterium]|nr:DUF5818 domain-containing protein [Bryobacteraceae bacterium]